MNASPLARAETMRIDLHCHTEASHDCRTPLMQIPKRCLERQLDVLAVTDHNQIWGAVKLQEMVAERTDLTVIVGEEVSTREGELIGLFLHENIPAGLTPEQTVAAIRDQGGLVLLPHGFDPLKANRLRPTALERIADQIDIVEVFNARISRPSWNRAASTWAAQHHRVVSAGSDAHLLSHIGDAWVEAPRRQIASNEDLLTALREGQVAGNWTHPAFAFMQKLLHVER
jgi:predicted metal-dependent phosphoesterase TrpH